MSIDSCNEYQVLISADLDGELDQCEQVVLQRHLTDCRSCRDWQTICRQIADPIAAVAALQCEVEPPAVNGLALNGMSHPAVVSNHPLKERRLPKPEVDPRSMTNGSVPWFLGIAAVLLVAIGISFGVFSRRQPSPALYNVEPLVAMHAINMQTEQDQQSTLRAVAMELRMLKLEMKQVAFNPETRVQMEQRIDSLLAKTKQLDSSTQISFQGELP